MSRKRPPSDDSNCFPAKKSSNQFRITKKQSLFNVISKTKLDYPTLNETNAYETSTDKLGHFESTLQDIVGKFEHTYDMTQDLLPILKDLKHFSASRELVNTLLILKWETKSIETIEMYIKIICELSTTCNLRYLVQNSLKTKCQFLLPKSTDLGNEEQRKEYKRRVEMVHLIQKKYIAKYPEYLQTFFDAFTTYIPSPKKNATYQAYLKNLLEFSLYIPKEYKEKVLTIIKTSLDEYYCKNVSSAEEKDSENFISLFDEVLTFLDDIYQPLNEKVSSERICSSKYPNDSQFLVEWFKCDLTSDIRFSGFKSSPFFLFYLIGLDYLKQPNKTKTNLIFYRILEYYWLQVKNQKLTVEARQTAVYFISSLMVHADFIPDKGLWECMGILTTWLHSFLDSLPRNAADSRVFYAVWNSVMYVFINRFDGIMRHPKEFEFVETFCFKRIVNSKLAPFQACDPRLGARFLELTKFCQLVYYSTNALKAKGDRLAIQDVLQMAEPEVPSPKIKAFYRPARNLDEPFTTQELEMNMTQFL